MGIPYQKFRSSTVYPASPSSGARLLCDPVIRIEWTDERIELLKQLWQDGFTGSQIAKRIGGTTRCAVIGKAHRLGLATKSDKPRRHTGPSLSKRQRQIARRKSSNIFMPRTPFQAFLAQDTEPYTPPADEVVIPLKERKTVQTLEKDDCRWPIGDPQHADFHFCGKEKIEGLPYCAIHARRAYQPQQVRQSRQAPTPVPTFKSYIDETVN